MQMQTKRRLAAFLAVAVFAVLAGCGDDENEIARNSYFTGLWRMETPGPLVQTIDLELEQDAGALEGNFYIEQLGNLGDAIPLLGGTVSGATASFDMDVAALPADDPLRTLITIDTLRCSVVVAIEEGVDTSAAAAPAAPAAARFELPPGHLAARVAGAAGGAKGGADIEPVRIDTAGRPCPLDTIWIGPDGIEFEPVQFTASGGTPPYIWGAYNLPFGLSIDVETGLVDGEPLEIPGDYTFYVYVVSLEDVETIHFDATLENPDLLRVKYETCASGLCAVERIPAERKTSGF